MSSPIPIKNIYFLLIYSWNSLAEGEIANVSDLESNELVDLFASVLGSGINHLLRRGLDQTYVLHEEEIAGVRGRINIGITARRMLVSHGRTYCEFDELSVDTLPNQVLLSTVLRLLKAPNLDDGLRLKLRGVRRNLAGISNISLTKHAFRKIQLHGNNRAYRFLLKVCELVLDMSIISEEDGSYQFRDFIRDERQMAKLFESFVFNFYKSHRPDLTLKRERIYWQASSTNDPALRYMPSMETDISVRSRYLNKTLIIDTKFYQQTFQKYYDRETIHSANLYQIFAYLKNLEVRGGADACADGMLLYPVVDRSLRLEYDLPGHSIQICTLNLAADWQSIHRELMGLVPNQQLHNDDGVRPERLEGVSTH